MSDLWSSFWPYLAALLPTCGLLYLFWMVMKHIVEGDRRERQAQSQWEAEQDALKNATHAPPATDRPE